MFTQKQIDQLCINTIRTLSIDAVQQANSGHPGTPMAMAPVVYGCGHKWLVETDAERGRQGRAESSSPKSPCPRVPVSPCQPYQLVLTTPVVYCLWQRFLRFDPNDPIWPNRDRFVLSIGHASMLLYSLLHLCSVKAVNA